MIPFDSLATALSVGFAFAVLAASIFTARRSGGRRRGDRRLSGRAARILLPSFVYSAGIAAFFAILFAGEGPLGPLAFGFIIFLASALIVVSLFDVAAVASSAGRDRRWLIIAIATFLLPPLGVLVATSGISAVLYSFDAVATLTLAPAAAFIWWSFLPSERREAGRESG